MNTDSGSHLDGEAEAVMRAIDDESRAFFNKDFEALSRRWVHAPYVRRLAWWSRGGVVDRWGWDIIGDRTKLMMQYHPEPNASAQEFRRENLVVRVSGDLAFATFDQYAPDTGDPDFDMPGVSRESRVLERHEGQWRIIYHTYIHESPTPARSPMLRVNRDARVSWRNKAADRQLGAWPAIAVVSGRLHARNRDDDRRLQQAIVAAADSDATLDGELAATPVVLEAGVEDQVCVCWVLPEHAGSGAVLVSLNNLIFAQDQIDEAASAFGLSLAQRRLAELIVAGRDLIQAASDMGISTNTAKTHLRRIFEKTGARNQATLVRALLSLSLTPGRTGLSSAD
jgi:DNA-binding CsgD family transcriptional regulator